MTNARTNDRAATLGDGAQRPFTAGALLRRSALPVSLTKNMVANGNRIRQHGCSGRSGNAAAPDPQARGTELPEDILPSFYVTESAHKCAPSAHVSHLRGNKGLWQSTNWTENTTT
jgi:hypothetical protein